MLSPYRSLLQLKNVKAIEDFFEEWNETTPQTHIRKFEEHMARGRLPCWGSSGLVWTLWMSETTASKASVLKRFLLQNF